MDSFEKENNRKTMESLSDSLIRPSIWYRTDIHPLIKSTQTKRWKLPSIDHHHHFHRNLNQNNFDHSDETRLDQNHFSDLGKAEYLLIPKLSIFKILMPKLSQFFSNIYLKFALYIIISFVLICPVQWVFNSSIENIRFSRIRAEYIFSYWLYWFFIWLTLVFVLFICSSPSANIRATEKRILDRIIGAGYDSRIRPMGNASVGIRGGGKSFFCSDLFQ